MRNLKKYTWDKIVSQMIKLYEDVLCKEEGQYK